MCTGLLNRYVQSGVGASNLFVEVALTSDAAFL
jgi:hypothetical protein